MKILACRPVYLAGDLSVFVLLRIEVVQRAYSGNIWVSVIAEHGHEACVPEEDVLIESSIYKLRDKPAFK